MQVQTVILAAGKGTRMVSRYPKVLHEVGGRPMLAHVLEAAQAQAPEAITIVVGYGADQVEEAFARTEARFVRQEVQKGTGHAVACAGPDFAGAEWVVVLNGDVPLLRGQTLSDWLADMEGTSTEVGILTARPPDPTGYGRVLRNTKGCVTGIREEKDAAPEELGIPEVFTGILAVRRERLAQFLTEMDADNAQGEYYITDVVEAAASEAGVHAHCLADPGEVQGVNDRTQLAAAEAIYQRRQAKALMDGGVTLRAPERTTLLGSIQPGPDTVIEPDCHLEGEVALGEAVHIGPGCFLRDCRLESEAVIEAHSHIDGAQVGPGARVGPFARLRTGTRLAAKAQVGNFVETKNAHLAEGVKANHLSYVGDAEVGPEANLGAGTITCNYDGHAKHSTQIGAGAFIGSAVQLVAPVRIGEKATIGSGSTITKDAPDGALTLARSKQITKHDWRRPEDRKGEEG